MAGVEAIEKQLPGRRKALLGELRQRDWEVVSVSTEVTQWWHDQIWRIASTRENDGFVLHLRFNRHDGEHDGLNNVVVLEATDPGSTPNPYSPEGPQLDFNAAQFKKNLECFMDALHELRLSASLT